MKEISFYSRWISIWWFSRTPGYSVTSSSRTKKCNNILLNVCKHACMWQRNRPSSVLLFFGVNDYWFIPHVKIETTCFLILPKILLRRFKWFLPKGLISLDIVSVNRSDGGCRTGVWKMEAVASSVKVAAVPDSSSVGGVVSVVADVPDGLSCSFGDCF